MRVLTQSNGLVNRGGEGIKGGGRRGRRPGPERNGTGRGRLCALGHGDSFNRYLLSIYTWSSGLGTRYTAVNTTRAAYNLLCARQTIAKLARHHLLVKTGEGTARCWRLGVAVSATGFCNSTALHILNWITVCCRRLAYALLKMFGHSSCFSSY